MSSLVAEHLEFGYGNAIAHSLDFSFNGGDLVCLLGPNGCGKSTLLHTLSGALRPVAGKILLNGKKVNELDLRLLARQVVLVRMGLPLTPWMSVEEFVSLGRSPYAGMFDGRSEQDLQLVENALVEMDLSAFRKRKLTELSDGERSRVYLAKALVQQVNVLLLDEPDAFLDVPRRRSLYQTLKNLAKEKNMIALVSTHSVAHAEKYADKLISFYGEGCVAVGPVTEIRENGFLKWTEE